MSPLRAALAWIRHISSSISARGPAFWAITLLIALLVPAPIAAPVLYARLRRDRTRRTTAAGR